MNDHRSRRKALSILLVLAFATFGLQRHVSAAEYKNPHLLVVTEELAKLATHPDVRIVDVRPQRAYSQGHIPGAVHLGADNIIDWNSHVQGALLPRETLVKMLEKRGIGRDTHVVLYDDRGGFHASRLFWMLEYFGHGKVSVLNGGFPKWQREGRKVSTIVPKVKRANFTPTMTPRKVASADWLIERRNDPSVVVIDVRPGKLYKAGHIPWAKNIPWVQNLGPDGTLKSADMLLKHFSSVGVTQNKNIAVHCQNGKAAAHTYFTLRLLGYPRVRSYDRSWAEWGKADDLPKASEKQG